MMGQLYLLLAAACWGISIPISTMLLKEVSPYQMMTLQLLGSNLFLAALVLFNKLDMESIASIFKKKKLGDLSTIVFLGILEPGLAYLLGFYGMARTSSVTSSIIIGLEPIFILLLNFAIFRNKAPNRTLSLVLLSFLGVALVVMSSANSLENFTVIGTSLVALGTFVAAIYVSISGKIVLDYPPQVYLLVGQFASLLFLALFGFVSGETVLFNALPSIGNIAAILLTGMVQFGVSFWAFFRGMKSTNVLRATSYINLIPIFGVIFSIAILGEVPQYIFYLGAGIVLVSVYCLEAGNHAHHTD